MFGQCSEPGCTQPGSSHQPGGPWCNRRPLPEAEVRRQIRRGLVALVIADMAKPAYGDGLPSSAYQLGLLTAAAFIADGGGAG